MSSRSLGANPMQAAEEQSPSYLRGWTRTPHLPGNPIKAAWFSPRLFDKDSLNPRGDDVGAAAQDQIGPAVRDKKPSLFVDIA